MYEKQSVYIKILLKNLEPASALPHTKQMRLLLVYIVRSGYFVQFAKPLPDALLDSIRSNYLDVLAVAALSLRHDIFDNRVPTKPIGFHHQKYIILNAL